MSRNRNRKKVNRPWVMAKIIVSVMTIVVMLSGCEAGKDSHFDQIVIARTSDSISLDPAITTDFESFQVTSNIYENLVTTDRSGAKILPDLAKEWEISEDGLTFVFKLREDVLFHDNTPFDADAVVFNFNRWMDKDSPYHIGRFTYWNQSFGGDPGIIKSITALSKYTVEIVLNEPYTPILSVLAMPAFGIASPEAVIKHNENFGKHPNGTGPYAFESWSDSGEILLVRNDHYRKRDVSIEEVVFKTLKGEDDYVAMLESGEIHIVNQITATDVERLEASEEVELYYLPFLNISYLALNHLQPPMNQVEVRQAINKVIDKNKMIEASYDVLSRPAYSFLPPTMFGYNESFNEGYDLKRARNLMIKAGYEEGFEATLWVMDQPRTYYPNPQLVAEYLKEELAKIKIDLTIETIPWDEYVNVLRDGDHDMALVGWQGDYADPDNFLYTMFYSDNLEEGTVLNYSFYTSEEVDGMLRRGRRVQDEAFRASVYRDLQDALAEDVASVPLAHTMMALGVNHRVKGFEPDISGSISIIDIEMVYEQEGGR